MIPVGEFQLIGVCALWISAKLEEIYVPELKYFSQATGYSYTDKDICLMERRMIQLFGYKLHKVTLQTWTEVYTKSWDHYADCNNLHQFTELTDISIRQFSADSYNRLRQIYEIVDALVLQFDSRWFDQRRLVAAILYLMIGGSHGMQVFPQDSELAFNFSNFGMNCFENDCSRRDQIAFYN